MKSIRFIFIRLTSISLLIFCSTAFSQSQSAPVFDCTTAFDTIANAFNEGRWSVAKAAAKEFIRSVNVKESNFFLSPKYRTYKHTEKNIDCDDHLGDAYYYLVKSCIRLFETDTAIIFYREALKRRLDPKKELLEQDLGKAYRTWGRLIAPFAGIANPLTRKNYKLGVQIGLGTHPLFFEFSYRSKYINHVSDQVSGGFGKILTTPPGVYPKYKFNFIGHERLVEGCYFYKFPLVGAAYIPSFFSPYFLAGVSMSYYINTSIDSYQVDITKNATDPVTTYASGPGRSTTSIDELKMDLTNFYSKRFSYGIFAGYGGCVVLKKDFVVFVEAKYYIGSNYQYAYSDLNTFRPGVNYFSFTAGFALGDTRLFNKKLKSSKNAGMEIP